MEARYFIASDIVHKLVGPITPAADESIDGQRLKNLHELCRVTGMLIFDIEEVALMATATASSVHKAGVFARDFLKELEEILVDMCALHAAARREKTADQ